MAHLYHSHGKEAYWTIIYMYIGRVSKWPLDRGDRLFEVTGKAGYTVYDTWYIWSQMACMPYINPFGVKIVLYQ